MKPKVIRRTWLYIVMAALVWLSCSPASSQTTDSAATSNTDAKPVPAARVRIGAGDLLEMSVFDVPEMTETIRVSDTGEGNVYLLGPMKLSGLTTEAAEQMIAAQFRERELLIDPRVHILIRDYGTQGVSLLGEVRRPGIYQVLGKRTLLDVISEAGGLTPLAGTKITVERASGEKQRLIAEISSDSAKSLSNDVELHPGDKVLVPRAGIVYVIGDVARSGGYLMQNNGKLSVLQALAMAAGVNHTASTGHARLLRRAATGISETQVDLKKILKGSAPDLDLQPEDIVFVPSSSTKSILQRSPSIVQTAASAVVYSSTTGALN